MAAVEKGARRVTTRERFTQQLQGAMEAMMGLGAAQLEAQAIEQARR
jgi:hypothetical protein